MFYKAICVDLHNTYFKEYALIHVLCIKYCKIYIK